MLDNFAPVINDPRTELSREVGHVTTQNAFPKNELLYLDHPETHTGEGTQERQTQLNTLSGDTNHPESNENFEVNNSIDFLASEESDEEFYTPGNPKLTRIRTLILENSVKKASERVLAQKLQAFTQNFTKTLKHRRNIASIFSKYDLHGSFMMQNNHRMLSRVRYNSNGHKIACSSWDGTFHILEKGGTDFYQQMQRLALGHHLEMATIAWSPKNADLLLSAGAEGKINVWDILSTPNNENALEEISPVSSMPEAHRKRIAQVSFHPGGDFFASVSHDLTWKFWDVREPNSEIFEQEGHAKEVHLMAFHLDGSLLATGGLDAVCLLWDLRSGRKVSDFQGHVISIYSMDFAPNGFHLATGGGDNSVKIWDLRKHAELFSIPAHSRVVSDVKFLQGTCRIGLHTSKLSTTVTDENDENPENLSVAGTCLVTSSYDKTVKVWSADNFVKIKTLIGHTDKVLSCDISSDGEEILSCGWDRTLRSWRN